MSDIGQRILGRRKELGLTQKELADACGIKQASVSAWERGDTFGVRPENLYLAAKRLGTTMEWLTSGSGPGGNSIAEAQALYNLEQAPGQFRQLPVIGWEEAVRWLEIITTFQGDPAEGRERVSTASKLGARAYALRVKGDSMTPVFPEGSTIVVDPDCVPRSGSYVVVRLRRAPEAAFRQLLTEGGRRYLKALNTRYPVMEFDEAAMTVCGVVRQVQVDFE